MTKTMGAVFGLVLVVTSLASAAAGAWGLIKFQSDVLPGRILVSETEDFLCQVSDCPCDEDDL